MSTNNSGKLNIYTCEKCRGHIVTKDVDAGVTPFMIRCYATEDCPGNMQSSMYRVFDQSMKASHEWYSPNKEELIKLDRWSRDHVAKGGLMMRTAK